jgi:hypothetical protein
MQRPAKTGQQYPSQRGESHCDSERRITTQDV